MQITMFDGEQHFKLGQNPIRLIELFAGYGSQSLALDYLGIPYESYRICEWAVKSIQAYKDLHFAEDKKNYSVSLTATEIYDYLFGKGISANYNEPMTYEQIKRLGEEKARQIYNNIQATHNLVSVCNAKGEDLGIVDTDKYDYIMTYSFPCQDLSSAGKRQGMEKDSGTRSGLLWEVERLLREMSGYIPHRIKGDNKIFSATPFVDDYKPADKQKLPQVLLMENVPEVIGSKNIKHFAKWVEFLDSLGYKSKWECLNAKNYGIPQNRNRCFMISILGDYYYDMPNPIPLKLRLKDMLEDKVDESFYLSEKAINGINNTSFNSAKLENRTEMGGCNANNFSKGL